ncbi:MAG: leucine-rich repeat protein [Lachnospiraceae bacterium]|nr:leucine-rich repeat protein [Lachnospiraceae bacterium]
MRINKLNNYLLMLSVMLMLFAMFFLKTDKVCAAESVGTKEQIGVVYNEQAGGSSVVGVRISSNGVNVCYALDTWEKTSGGEWEYCSSDINGVIGRVGETRTNFPANAIGLSQPRFEINLERIESYIPDRASVTLKKYRYGQLIDKKIEIIDGTTSDIMNENESIAYHMLPGQDKKMQFSSYASDGISYVYEINDMLDVKSGGDINIVCDGCTVESEGVACYDPDTGYHIVRFPEVRKEEPGEEYNFKGWYTSLDGGEQVTENTVISSGMTIYPRWERVLQLCEVTCIDRNVYQGTYTILGRNTIRAYEGETTGGYSFGNDTGKSVYYDGYYYTGQYTDITVQRGENIVYRDFCPITYEIYWDFRLRPENTALNRELLYQYEEEYQIEDIGNREKAVSNIIFDMNYQENTAGERSIQKQCSFKGWSDNQDNTVVYEPGTYFKNASRGERVTRYAVWECKLDDIDYVPEREGYTFKYWSLARNGDKAVSNPGNGDVTLYAIWQKNSSASTGGAITGNATTGTNQNNVSGSQSAGSSQNSGNSQSSSGSQSAGGSQNSGNSQSSSGSQSAGGSQSSGNSQSSSGSQSAGGSQSSGASQSSQVSQGSTVSSGSAGSWSSNGDKKETTKDTASTNNTSKLSGKDSNDISSLKSDKGSGTSDNSQGIKKDSKENSGDTSLKDLSGTAFGNADMISENKDVTTENKKGDNTSSNKKTKYAANGTVVTRKNIVYKVIKKGDVRAVKAKRKIKEIKIPDTITISGVKYKVVSIKDGAFQKKTKIVKVTVGKNVKTIGAKAFYKDKNIANIIIKSKKISKIGKNAFKGIKSGCVIKISGSKKYGNKIFAKISK